MFPVLQVGPLALQVPGLLVLLGLWLGLNLAERRAPRHDIHPETLYNLVFYSLAAGVIGARLAYAARFPDAFLRSPASLLSIQPGLFDPTGGLIIAVLTGWITIQRKSLDPMRTLDALTPLLAVLAVALPLANLSRGSGYGAAADLPWSIEIWGAARHPSQIYESLAAAAILFVLERPGSRQPKDSLPGIRFFSFVAFSAGTRLFLEAFRGDSALILGGLRVTQLAAWIIAAGSLYTLWKLREDRR